MSKTKVDFSALEAYLPLGSFEPILTFVHNYKIQLTVTKNRTSILGDYRHEHNGKGHRISINGDLNNYSFLITLLHEISHLITFENYKHTAQPHGIEWKTSFGNILALFINKNIFPQDIKEALVSSIKSPAASSCSDEKLLRVLKKYDKKKENTFFVEQLSFGQLFEIRGNRIFERGEKIRKRYKCKELATGKWYLFSPVSEVKMKI